MIKLVRMLAGGGLAAVLGVSAFATAGAESPPNPPARFAGTVSVDGAAPPAGTSIQAKIGNATCEVTTTFNTGATSNYVLDVPALDPGAHPNCGADGASIVFWIGDKQAKESGSWVNSQLNVLNLTYVTPPTPTATVVVPKPGATGVAPYSLDGGSDSNVWLFVALGLGAVVLGASGAAVSRRNR
jgi:hypothetical protein